MPARSALRTDPTLCQQVKDRYLSGERPADLAAQYGVSVATLWNVIKHGAAKPTGLIDITGKRFGRLLVLRRDGAAQHVAMWIVRCDCGVEKSVNTQSLRTGKQKTIIGCNCPPSTPEEDQERFWSKVDKRGENECWEWTASRSPFGYGRINIRGRIEFAHRMAVVFATGNPIPDGENVLHSCDNPPCCNPAHLRTGTQEDNAADRESRGRGNQPRGSKNGKTVFIEDEVVHIKRLLKEGRLNKGQIAEAFGCSRSAIEGIAIGRTWSHIKIN